MRSVMSQINEYDDDDDDDDDDDQSLLTWLTIATTIYKSRKA